MQTAKWGAGSRTGAVLVEFRSPCCFRHAIGSGLADGQFQQRPAL